MIIFKLGALSVQEDPHLWGNIALRDSCRIIFSEKNCFTKRSLVFKRIDMGNQTK